MVAGGLGALESGFGATKPKIWFDFGLGLRAANVHQFWVFWGPFGGGSRIYIVELEGPRKRFGRGKSSCMCRPATIPLHLAVLTKF